MKRIIALLLLSVGLIVAGCENNGSSPDGGDSNGDTITDTSGDGDADV